MEKKFCDSCGKSNTLLRRVNDILLCTWCAPFRNHGEEIQVLLDNHHRQEIK